MAISRPPLAAIIGPTQTTFDLGPVADRPKPSYFRPPPDGISDLSSLFPLEMAPSSQVGLPKRTLIGAQRSSLNSKFLKAYKLYNFPIAHLFLPLNVTSFSKTPINESN